MAALYQPQNIAPSRPIPLRSCLCYEVYNGDLSDLALWLWIGFLRQEAMLQRCP